MEDNIEWEGTVKHDETHIGGRLGFFVKNVRNSRLAKFLDRITPSFQHPRDHWFALPVEPEVAEGWEVGDEVKIIIEHAEGENQ